MDEPHAPKGFTQEKWTERLREVEAIRARAEQVRREKEQRQPKCRWVQIGDEYYSVIPHPERTDHGSP